MHLYSFWCIARSAAAVARFDFALTVAAMSFARALTGYSFCLARALEFRIHLNTENRVYGQNENPIRYTASRLLAKT